MSVSRLTARIALPSLFLFLAVVPASAATFCRQSFTLLGCTGRTQPVVWIGLHLGGECEQRQLLQLECGNETADLTAHDLRPGADWSAAQDLVAQLEPTPYQPLAERQGRWPAPGNDWSVQAPAPRDDLLAAFRDHVASGGSDARTWRQQQGRDTVTLPRLAGVRGQLRYALPEGLYVNYDIAAAVYLPRGRYLLIFTRQPETAAGGDTMHGLLLLQLAPEASGPDTEPGNAL